MPGVECYKISIQSPIGQTTAWIDTSQFLLRRMHLKYDMKAFRNMMPQGTNANLNQTKSTHDFIEQKVNQPVPDKLFSKP